MRSLPYPFELVLQENRPRPDYKILAFNPKLDSISDVVCGTYSQEPFDLTSYCSDISWTPTRLSFTLQDGDAIFHPDFGASRRYLVDGAIIRLIQGGLNISSTNWVNTFTGQIQGQIGWRKSRRSRTLEAKVSVYSRENNQSWKRRSITTKIYTAGTEIGVVLRDVCTEFMGMTEGEIRIPSTLGLQLKHQVNQLVQVSPWEGITSILEAVGAVPFFDGDGRLSCFSKNMVSPESRLMSDWKRILDYEVPEYSQEAINQIRLIFLDSALEEIDGTYQILGSATITAGFFSSKLKIECWWSDDRKQRAKNTRMVVKQSVVTKIGQMTQMGNFGAKWAEEDYDEIDDFHGEIVVTVPWTSPAMLGAGIVEYLISAYIGDGVPPVVAGMTIPIGKLYEALTLVQILAIMSCIGTGQYEVWGTPYDYVYAEKQSIAVECNIPYWQINERTIQNDFIGTYEQADAIVLLELIWEKSKCFPRKLTIQDDPALEVGDMIRLPDGLKFFITGMSKSIQRGDVPILVLDGFKVKRS